MPKKKVYLDNAATTPVSQAVLKKMLPFFDKKFGNPLTNYDLGEEAAQAVENTRNIAAQFFGVKPSQIIFTSGATESNNFVLKGVVDKYFSLYGETPHIITSRFEHSSVLATLKFLEKKGLAEITYLSPNKEGLINPSEIKRHIQNNTALISLMYVNNEIGTILPIAEIGKIIKEINKKKEKKVLFHTDAVQAVNYLPCSASYLGVDFLSISGHKIYGPKGIGLLVARKKNLLTPLLHGGGQEDGYRSGTHNVAGIIGLGEALRQVEKRQNKKNSEKIKKLRDYLVERVLKEIPDSALNGSLEKRIPSNANFRFASVEGESLVMWLNMEGISAGTGSACSSKSLRPSHVLLSLGLRPEEAHGSLRLVLDHQTSKEDVDYVVSKLKSIVERLRKISGNVLEEFK